MSEDLFATLVTLGILAAMAIWPHLLQSVCPACSRLLSRPRTDPATRQSRPSRPRTARRRADHELDTLRRVTASE